MKLHKKKLASDLKMSDATLRKTIKERSKKKAQFAFEQLKVLETIRKKSLKNLKILKGFFAGAFGFAQFIPSSFLTFGVSADSHAKPNLFTFHDAI